ncbi:MAG: tetratricopeptide repeat protein [Deltaproteobacteria bacterium]|uniref:Tetratricopeptide repeat protein n=1 Tax=Candidatus Zymogenus saltonus TaxID=2844893 RepID=A0A9D8KG64_9DELT|nr:tetratricopeptide repeat protein [Candidatus Zymogenus saltonus]
MKKELSRICNDYAIAFLSRGGDQKNPSREDLQKAKDMYNVAMALDERNIDSVIGLASIYRRIEKDYKTALKYYEYASKIDPEDPGAKYGIKICTEELMKLNK